MSVPSFSEIQQANIRYHSMLAADYHRQPFLGADNRTRVRRILEELVAADPAPEEMAAFLFDVHKRFDTSTCSLRSLALAVLQEWQVACSTPSWGSGLLDLAARQSHQEAVRRGQQLPG